MKWWAEFFAYVAIFAVIFVLPLALYFLLGGAEIPR